MNVGPSTPFNMTAASKVTVNCARQLTTVGTDLVADKQDLVFVTSADTLQVPLAAIGSFARETADQVKAEVNAKTQTLINNVNAKFSKLDLFIVNTVPSTVTWAAGDISCTSSCPDGYVLSNTSYENPGSSSDCNAHLCIRFGVKLKTP